ncbi:hypothetical protein HDV57DRAFT_506153 [Trichoderma longibrachiatum]
MAARASSGWLARDHFMVLTAEFCIRLPSHGRCGWLFLSLDTQTLNPHRLPPCRSRQRHHTRLVQRRVRAIRLLAPFEWFFCTRWGQDKARRGQGMHVPRDGELGRQLGRKHPCQCSGQIRRTASRLRLSFTQSFREFAKCASNMKTTSFPQTWRVLTRQLALPGDAPIGLWREIMLIMQVRINSVIASVRLENTLLLASRRMPSSMENRPDFSQQALETWVVDLSLCDCDEMLRDRVWRENV